jgi:hypothetical protein
MASKYRVQDANATGIGRSISWKKEKGFSFQMQVENTNLLSNILHRDVLNAVPLCTLLPLKTH